MFMSQRNAAARAVVAVMALAEMTAFFAKQWLGLAGPA